MIHEHKQSINIEDIIHSISFHPNERLDVFLKYPPQEQAFILLQLTKHIQRTIVGKLSDTEIISILENLDPDEATDIIQFLAKSRQKILISHLNEELQQSVLLLSQFDPETAAGLMNVDYIQVDENDTIEVIAKRFKSHENRTGRSSAIIVMAKGKLAGYLPVHELGLNLPEEKINKHIQHIHSIKYDMPHDDVIRAFREYPHNKLAVLGEKENVVGIIYTDDVLRLLEKQESASLYDFAGVSEEESVMDLAGRKIKNRYKWLIINLATAFLAASTVGLFDETISKYVLLAVYMPIVAGMGGNAATQTLAVLVRGIALKQITLKTASKTLKNELGAAIVNGLINGVLVAVVVLIVNRDLKIALILAIAMIVNLFVAGLFGTLVPLIMKRLGKDPATSATIFITTATDVLGFLVFLGLAKIVLD